MYVLAGLDINGKACNSIEKLTNIVGSVPSALPLWQLIQLNKSFEPRFQTVFCAWNEQEMVFLGGLNQRCKHISDGWVLDARTETIRQVVQPSDNSIKFHS